MSREYRRADFASGEPHTEVLADDTVVGHLSTAVLILDADLRVADLNTAAEVLLDVSAKQVRGAALTNIFPATRRYAPLLTRVLDDGHALTEREMTIELASGEPITVDCVVNPVCTETAGETLLIVELIDLHRHRRITREERLRAEHETGRALVRGLAHEIRNPLGGLRGAAQLLERRLEDESLREYTGVIVREADRLQGLLDRMLGPRQPPCMQTINVHEVTERVFTLICAETPDVVQVERDYDPSLPEIKADPERLIQALLNVARNAVQAIDCAGRVVLRTRVERQLTIGRRRHRLAVRIDVIDNGPGISEALAERIFFPLVTGRGDGTGLGLSIAQGVAHEHGGLIECASTPGETVFSLLLPACSGEVE